MGRNRGPMETSRSIGANISTGADDSVCGVRRAVRCAVRRSSYEAAADYRGRKRLPGRGCFTWGGNDRATGTRIRFMENQDPHGHRGVDKEKNGGKGEEH